MAGYQLQREIEIQNLALGLQISLLDSARSFSNKSIISQEENDCILAQAFAEAERTVGREAQAQGQRRYGETRERHINWRDYENSNGRRYNTLNARHHEGEKQHLRYLRTEETLTRPWPDGIKWSSNIQIPQIQGSPEVTSQLINNYVNHCSRQNCDVCRRMMQKARLIVTNTPKWCRANFELTCYAEHFSLIFWSGSRKNKMVIQAVDEKIEVTVTEESWRMWFRRVANDLKSTVKNAAVYCFNKGIEFFKSESTWLPIGGAILQAITL